MDQWYVVPSCSSCSPAKLGWLKTMTAYGTFLSVLGDGICIIDLLKGTAHPLGIASFNELYDAAYWIIHECVMGDEVGGRAVNIGKVFGFDFWKSRTSSLFPPCCRTSSFLYRQSVWGSRLQLCVVGPGQRLPSISSTTPRRRYRFHHHSKSTLQKTCKTPPSPLNLISGSQTRI